MEQNTAEIDHIPTSNNRYILIGLVLLIIGFGLGYLLGKQSSSSLSTSLTPSIISPTVTIFPTSIIESPINSITQAITPGISPNMAVSDFYLSHLDCIKKWDANPQGKTRVEACPYANNQYLSQSLIEKLKVYDNQPYNPILCSQAYPTSLRVESISQIDKDAQIAVIEKYFSDQTITVTVNNINGQWILTDIACFHP